MSNFKIGLVTPLRNEEESIPRLMESVESQSVPIYCWIIVENDSTDSSKALLEAAKNSIVNVEHLIILNLVSDKSAYELGSKYANIVNTGFEKIRSTSLLDQLDFIGIQDADCFPEENYFKELSVRMDSDPNIGIASGLMYHDDGSRDIASKDWVLGGCRLWKIDCFRQAGYHVTPSADTISVCKAILKGWRAIAYQDLRVISREMGAKVNYAYYGRSWYFRGHTPFFGSLIVLKLIFKGKLKWAQEFSQGFYGDWLKGAPRIQDEEVLNYYKNHLSRKLKVFYTKS